MDPEYQVCGKAAKNGKLYTGKYSDKTAAKKLPKPKSKKARTKIRT